MWKLCFLNSCGKIIYFVRAHLGTFNVVCVKWVLVYLINKKKDVKFNIPVKNLIITFYNTCAVMEWSHLPWIWTLSMENEITIHRTRSSSQIIEHIGEKFDDFVKSPNWTVFINDVKINILVTSGHCFQCGIKKDRGSTLNSEKISGRNFIK